MKVAIFSDFFMPEISGVTDSVILLGQELARRGHTIMFVVPWYSKSDYQVSKMVRDDDFGPNIIVKRLPSLPIPFSLTGQMRLPLFLGLGVYWTKKFKPDIIHTHSPVGPGYEAKMAAKLFNIPIVGTNHTPMSEFLKGPKWFINAVCRHYSKFYDSCLFVSTPSQYLLNYMIGYGLTQKNSKPISNPMNIVNFLPVKDEIEKNVLKNKFSFSPHTVLYTGRLAEEKHIDDIIRAVAIVQKEIPDITLAITGHGNAEKKLRALVTELGLTEKVKFLGFVDKEIYPLVYQASDLFVIMSTAESQSISLISAMASGLPVIGANSRALPEYINNTNGVVVEVGDYKTLAKEMVRILQNKELAQKLGAGGVLTAAKYSATNVAKEWEGIYNAVIC